MVSIIILNHNNKEIITKCLDSVIKYSKNMEYELIVVDNQNTDGSLYECSSIVLPLKA